MRIIIEKNTPHRTVKEYLKYELQLSTGLISALKRKERGICLDGMPVTVRHPLTPPCVLELDVEDGEESKNPFLEPEDLPLDVVWEDEHLAVLNKPPYMPTHPSLGHRSGTLANALAYHRRGKETTFVFRPINRLDRDTSGLVLCAYDRIAAARYTQLLKQGSFEKIYLAVVVGEMHGSGSIEKPIRRAETSIILRETCAPEADGAEYAKTEYEVLKTDGTISVLRVKPITGRTHQIRVHLASLGHPILGDRLYGEESSVMPRQALHAIGLTVRDGAKIMRFFAPIPKDIDTCIKHILPSLHPEELL
jgi:23S rRNA pseudouridine1911/1915/1917 synthase